MALLNVLKVTEAGAPINLQTPIDAVDTVSNSSEKTVLVLDNSGASAAACTVTLTAQKTTFNDSAFGPSQKASIVYNLNANDKLIVGLLSKIAFNNDNGRVELTYGGDTTGLTVGAIEPTK